MKKLRWYYFPVFALAVGIFLVRCSSSNSSSSGTVTVAGTLATSSSRDAAGKDIIDSPSRGLETYSIRCVTLTGTPQAASGTCDTTGAYSLSLPGAQGANIGCFVMQSNAIVATVTFNTANTTTLSNGTTASAGSVTPSGSSVSLPIILHTNNNTATVDTTQATGLTTSGTGTWNDMTGTWATSSCTSLAADGTLTACPTNQNQPGSIPATIYLDSLTAKDATNKTHYGLGIWQDSASFQTCGSAEGVNLPSGWTAVSNNFGAISYRALNASTILDSQNISGSGTSTTCASLSNPNQAYCFANATWADRSSSICQRTWNVNWSIAQTGGTPSCTSSQCVNGSGTPWVTDSGMGPRNRFVSGEVFVTGTTGTLAQDQDQNNNVCTNADPTVCNAVSCPVHQHIDISINQSSATTATVGLNIRSVLAPGANTACSGTQASKQLGLGTQQALFTITKQ